MAGKYERESPWDWDDFVATFQEDLWDIAVKVNWDGSGEDTMDVYQWLWMHFWENWDKAQWWKESVVTTNARKEAAAHAEQERLQYMAGMGCHIYTRAEIESRLYHALWDSISEAPDIDAHIDLNQAMKSLGKAQKSAVYRYYCWCEEFERDSTDLKNKNRGIQNILAFLNINYPPEERLSLTDAEDLAVSNITGHQEN